MFEEYRHIVYFVSRNDESFLRIDRLLNNGRTDFYTEIKVPESISGDPWKSFDTVSESLGKSICIDNPSLRRELGIDSD